MDKGPNALISIRSEGLQRTLKELKHVAIKEGGAPRSSAMLFRWFCIGPYGAATRTDRVKRLMGIVMMLKGVFNSSAVISNVKAKIAEIRKFGRR